MECGMVDEECSCVEGFQPYEDEERLAMRNAEGDFSYSESEDSLESSHSIEREDLVERGEAVVCTDIMSRVKLEKHSEETLKQFEEERQMYTQMYKKVISDSWIGVKEDSSSEDEPPNLVDEDSDEESETEDSVDETKVRLSIEEVDMLNSDDSGGEDDVEYNLLVARYNKDRKVQKKELGSCKRKKCRRNRKIIRDMSQEGWMRYWKRMSRGRDAEE